MLAALEERDRRPSAFSSWPTIATLSPITSTSRALPGSQAGQRPGNRRPHRGEAREHLQAAHGMLQEMEIGAFGDRAGRMLTAASGTRRARPLRVRSPGDALTEQEAQIARLARGGLSNPEIGTRLFISTRTVQYHLGKVFTKLGITSRSLLQWALSSRRDAVPVGAVSTA